MIRSSMRILVKRVAVFYTGHDGSASRAVSVSCQATSCGVRSNSTLLWLSAPPGELDGGRVRDSAALD